jgi:hypothetical protein
MKKPRILFYDIETSLMKAYVWQCGKQVVRHGQLDKLHNQPRIICVTYCWSDSDKVYSIDWGYEEQDTAKVVREFDEIIKQADHIIGKNSNKFDNKMVTAARMLSGLPGMPLWTKSCDDLEVQMRRNFRLPSHALDYISAQLGYGGKIKMEMQDWVDILEKNPGGEKKLAKMIKYGKKDVLDTKKLWEKLAQHFDPKFNYAKFMSEEPGCKHCGSKSIRPNGSRLIGMVRWNQFTCNDCGRYAGKSKKEGALS